MAQESLENTLQGMWLIDEIIQQGKDVSSEHNPKNNRFIIFKSDGTFESGGDPYGKNTGDFYVNGLTSGLHLDSDSGPDDDSYWSVTIKKGLMYWRGTGSEFAKEFEIRYKKK